jgi:hypothetical protein
VEDDSVLEAAAADDDDAAAAADDDDEIEPDPREDEVTAAVTNPAPSPDNLDAKLVSDDNEDMDDEKPTSSFCCLRTDLNDSVSDLCCSCKRALSSRRRMCWFLVRNKLVGINGTLGDVLDNAIRLIDSAVAGVTSNGAE